MERKSDVLLQADHMRKEFGITKAVKDIDLTIYRGEVRTLIGETVQVSLPCLICSQGCICLRREQ